MADDDNVAPTTSMNGRTDDADGSGTPADDSQWVSIYPPDIMELDRSTLSAIQALPPGTILLDPGKGLVSATSDVTEESESAPLQSFYLRPVLLNDNQDGIPAILTRSQDRGLDNDDSSSQNPELPTVHLRDATIELGDSNSKNGNANHVSSHSELESTLRLDGNNMFIRDDNLNEPQAVDVSWAQEPNPVILTVDGRGLLPKSDGDIMVDVGVRAHNDPWLATFEDTGLQKSPSGRALEAVPEELSPLVDGSTEKIGDYLEAEDQEGGANSSLQDAGKPLMEISLLRELHMSDFHYQLSA